MMRIISDALSMDKLQALHALIRGDRNQLTGLIAMKGSKVVESPGMDGVRFEIELEVDTTNQSEGARELLFSALEIVGMKPALTVVP